MKHILLLFFSFISFAVLAQVHICGTVDDGSMLKRLEENKIAIAEKIDLRNSDEWIFVPIQFHIVSAANGVGGIDEARLLDELCTINRNYAKYKMKFFLAPEFSYIKNDALYNDPGSNFAEARIRNTKNSAALNIFVVNDIASGNSYGQILGYFSPILDIIVIRKNQVGINNQTVSHEIGHFFSLKHPFYGWEADPYRAEVHGNPVNITKIKWGNQDFEIELMDGSNCDHTADRLCDTPPDYNFGILDPESDCKLNGPILDYNEDTIVTMENNYMGYFFNCGHYAFTPQQVAVMRADYFHALRASIRPGAEPDTMLVDEENFKISWPPDGHRFNYYEDIKLFWHPVDGATDYLVSVNRPATPNLVTHYFVKGQTNVTIPELEKGRRYSWNVRPYNIGNTCPKRLGPWSFWTGEWPVSIEDELAAGEDFQVFPNPLQGRHAHVYSKENANNMNVKLFNAFGQQIFDKNFNFISGTNYINLSNFNMPPGFYNLVFNNREKNYVRKIVVQ